VSDFNSATVSIRKLQAGDTTALLAEADVVIAVDAATAEEEVVYGRDEWELASETGLEEDLVVLRVELDLESGDLQWLVDAIEAIRSGQADEYGDDFEEDEELDEEE
jgi:hypothetical protein